MLHVSIRGPDLDLLFLYTRLDGSTYTAFVAEKTMLCKKRKFYRCRVDNLHSSVDHFRFQCNSAASANSSEPYDMRFGMLVSQCLQIYIADLVDVAYG